MKIGRVAGGIVLASVLTIVGLAFTAAPTGAQKLQQCYTPPCVKATGVPVPKPIAPGKVVTGFGGTAPVAGKASVVLGSNPAGKPVSTLPNTGGAVPTSNNILPAILVALGMLALVGTMRLWSTQRAP